jgi:hypothetical protein
MPSTPSPCVAVVSSKIATSQATEKKKGRGTVWIFIEMLCAFLVVAGVNMKITGSRTKRELLTHQNDDFKYQVQSKWDAQVREDEHGIAEDKKTPAICIQERVHDIKTDT